MHDRRSKYMYLIDEMQRNKNYIVLKRCLCRVGTEREMQINTVNVTSTPDLHFVKNMPATRFQVIRTTLLACVEVSHNA